MSKYFETHEKGEIEFIGNDEDQIRLFEELKKFDREEIFIRVTKSIEDVNHLIEDYFEKLE